MKKQNTLRLVDARRLDRGQWLEVRRGGIGSSDAATAFSLNSATTGTNFTLTTTEGRASALSAYRRSSNDR